jgi:hypothetical protein
MRRADALLAALLAAATAFADVKIDNTQLPDGTLGQPYSTSLRIREGTAPYLWTLDRGELPPGLSLGLLSGDISGRPSQAGAFRFDVRVVDARLTTDRAGFRIMVAQGGQPLTISTSSLPGGTVGVAYTTSVNAQGGTPPYVFGVSAGSLPPGIVMLATGQVGGLPSSPGDFGFEVTARDAVGATATGKLSISILGITSTLVPNGTAGFPYSATLTAAGGSSYNWSAAGLPPGISLNPSSGALSGTPSNPGPYNFTAQVSSGSLSASRPFSMTIHTPLAVAGTLPGGIVGTLYSANPTVSGGSAPYTWSVSGGSLPPGLNLNTSSGAIGGTPSRDGSFNFSLRVTDSAGALGQGSFSIGITPPVSITTTSLPNGTVGSAYSATVAPTGGTPPYKFSISAGALPTGLSLGDADGRITGTPSEARSFPFTVRVDDSVGGNATKDLSITVAPPPPSITTASLPDGTAGTPYSATVNATNGTPPYSFSISSGSLPQGLNLGRDGAISGTPAAAGNSNFTVEVRDSADVRATRRLSIRIIAPLVITTASLPNGVVGAAYSATVAASGGSPPYAFSISAGSLPAGLNLGGGGDITGTPSTAGNSTFTVQARDAAGATTTKDFSISITASLAIATTSLPNGTTGTPYTANLTASGGAPPYTFTISAGSLPAGLNLGGGGDITGTPSTAANATFTVQARDAGGATATRDLSISIAAGLTIATTALPNGTAGVAYSANVTAAGGAPPYAFSIGGGSLPAGLNLGSGGDITGTPSTPGNAAFTVQARDSAGATATRDLSISIAAGTPALAITTASLPAGTRGSAYAGTVAASGGTPPYSFSITAGTLPPGLTLSGPNGEIRGTPTAEGSFQFTVQVTDAASGTASKALGIDVSAPAPRSLGISPATLPNGTTGRLYAASLRGSGGTEPYSWTVAQGALPPGLTLNVSTGMISGTPTQAGGFTFLVRLADSAGGTATAQLSITVASAIGITSSEPPAASLEAGYSHTFVATGGTEPYRWSVTSGELPPGLTLDAATGVLSGSATAPGSYSFTVQVSDAAGATASSNYTITAAQGFTITTTSPLPPAAIGTPYSHAMAAIGGSPPYRWSVSQGSLPEGLALNASTGVLSGTARAAGASTFTIRAADSASRAITKQFTLQVVSALTITTESLPNGSTGNAYSQALTAISGTSPYSWSITAGALPPGIALEAGTGLITGTPTETGKFDFTVQVTDAVSTTATKALSITIAPALAITTGELPPGVAGQAYSATLEASGGSPPYTWSIASGALPNGVNLDASAGALSGTPQAAGDYNVTVGIADNGSLSATRAYTFRVSLAAVPSLSISGLPETAAPLQQPRMEVRLAESYPVALSGELALSFQPDAAEPSDDPSIQFSSGGRTVAFSIPANSTEASFAVPLALQTGSVAGRITVQAKLRAGDADATPNPPPSATVQVTRTAPAIRSARLVRTANGFEVWVTGLSPPRDLTQATFRFTGAAGASLQTSEVTVQLADPARQWFRDDASKLFGSQFTLVQPFAVQGSTDGIASVSVTLSNSQGTSQAASANFGQ